ncbi:MAG: LptA/OstA family protein [Caulobacteraceae bacterium]
MASLKRFLTMSLACGGLLLCGQAGAQTVPGATTQTDVSSDRLVRYDAEHRAVYSGAVEVVMDGGKTRLTCDTLNIYFYGPGEGPNAAAPAKPQPAPPAGSSDAPTSGNIKQLVADGHVFYVTQNETARGDHGVYDAQPDIVTLTGGVIVVQGKNVLRGDQMVMDRKNGQTTVVSNATGRNNPNRVRSVIYNDNTQNGQGQPAQGQPAAKAPPPAPAKKP